MTGGQTGVGNTPVQNSIRANTLIDWLSYTGAANDGMQELWRGEDMLPWTLHDGPGRYGYSTRFLLASCELWQDGPGDTDHVDLSGKACRDLEMMAGNVVAPFDWQAHLAWLLDSGRKISRLDYSIDLQGPGVSVSEFADAIREGRIISRWKAENAVEMRSVRPDLKAGHTLYLGSTASDARLIIYDKKAEQQSEGESWVRIEMRCRHATAQAMTSAIAQGGMRAGTRALNGYVRFLDSTGNTLPIWEIATSQCSTSPLAVHQRGGTLESTRAWIHTQVAMSIALLLDLEGGDLDFLTNLVAEGKICYTARHKSIIAAAKARQNPNS